MWDPRPIEKILEKRLTQSLGAVRGKECFADYLVARRDLVEEVLPEIKAIEPDLTDHGAPHIGNVLDNIEQLLGSDIESLQVEELYALCVCVLFHDVGNFYGRKKHNRNISEIYEHIRKSGEKFRHEKLLVLTVAGAHSGKAKDGTSDTIKDVPVTMHLKGKLVRTKFLAALLRFADELAEGPQRTSSFRQAKGLYKTDSKIYHSYASVTGICIDRPGNRIALSYNFNIKQKSRPNSLALEKNSGASLEQLLEFTSQRVIKLDEERQYSRHYCDWLTPFKVLSVTFEFWHSGDKLETNLEPLVLSDLVVPGDAKSSIDKYDKKYSIKQLVRRISTALDRKKVS